MDMTTATPEEPRIITQNFSFQCGRFVLSQAEMSVKLFLHSRTRLLGWNVETAKSWLDGAVMISVTGPEDEVAITVKALYDWVQRAQQQSRTYF